VAIQCPLKVLWIAGGEGRGPASSVAEGPCKHRGINRRVSYITPNREKHLKTDSIRLAKSAIIHFFVLNRVKLDKIG
jgi:hypothetical protein